MRPRIWLALFTPLLGQPALAADFRLGGLLGYGGAGITDNDIVDGSKTTVQRSESPGTVSLSFEYIVSDRFSVGFEHSRGFRIGPFSSGVGLTGLAARWYFRSPLPTVARTSPDESTLLVKRYAFFLGGGTGIASGTISRPDDQVPDVTASGLYIGPVFGADYPLAAGVTLRLQLAAYTTFASTPAAPSTLSYFSLGAGFLFFL